jgi:hypothetical protein
MEQLTLTTPKAPCLWPKLNTPDVKFKAEGEYSISVILTPEQAEPLIKKATEHYEKFITEQTQLLNSKKPLKRADIGAWKDDVDKDGNPTGNVRFNIKMKASIISKKTGKKMDFKPAVFDKYGAPTEASFGSGSAVKVNFEVYPWYTAALGAGISFSLRAVQILEVRSSIPSNAKDFGFTAEIPEDSVFQPENDEAASSASAPVSGDGRDF